MGAGHTPGPWSATAPDGSYHDVIRIFADADPAGASPVAICPQRKSAIMEVFAGSTNETTEAACNARLIASAPEMYEALLLVLAGYTKLGPFDEPLGSSEQTAAINAARAAIAKATGSRAHDRGDA